MLFNSFAFAVFFPIVVLCYFALPHRFRWVLLLSASAYFYMALIPYYILILIFTILIDYVAGRVIDRAQGRSRKSWLVVSIVANVGVLAFFKYFDFLSSGTTAFLHALGFSISTPILNIALPIGLSFHTFQSMSYTIEVYHSKIRPERNLGIFALYVLFFPQLVAGPIERPQNLLNQFREPHPFTYENAANGMRLMAWGFIKKIAVADRLAYIVNPVYGHPFEYSGLPLAIATVAFSFQIYCDFSGYSDIARGAARIMGFRLMNNFDRPYFSQSISEFWRRWHISLSSWFRDYLYIPLGGNRVSRARQHRNLVIVFLLSGLWHGANWTFLMWGAVHAFFLILERAVFPSEPRFPSAPRTGISRLVRILGVFLIVSLAWVFFRAQSVGEAFYIITHLHVGLSMTSLDGSAIPCWDLSSLILTTGMVLLVLVVERTQRSREISDCVGALPAGWRWAIYYMGIILTLMVGVFGDSPFIYFQF